MLIQALAAFIIPIFSILVIKLGMKGHILILSSIFCTGSFSLFYFLEPEPSHFVLIGMSGVCIFFSLYTTVIWSSMALVVPQEATSIAFAIATTLQNVLMTALPIIFGYINKDQKPLSYNRSLLIFIILGLICTAVTIFTTFYDLAHGSVLYMSENNKEVLEERRRKSTSWRQSVLS